MAFYECVFIARQDLTNTQVLGMADSFEAILEERGGKLATKEYWGLRTMAYRMRKNRKGHYILMNIEAPAGAVQELQRVIRYNEDILRSMIIKVEALATEPSAMMAAPTRYAREEGGKREGGYREGGREGTGREGVRDEQRLRPVGDRNTADTE